MWKRLPYGLGTFWLTALVVTVGFAFGVKAGTVIAASMLLAVPVVHERRPVHVTGAPGLRLVARRGTTDALPWPVRVARHLLRFLLLPVLVLEFLVFLRRPHRCLHDVLTAAEVVLVRTSLPRVAPELLNA